MYVFLRAVTLWISILFVFIRNLAGQLVQVPTIQVCELGACRAFHAEHGPWVIGRDGNVEDLSVVARRKTFNTSLHT